MPFPIFALSAAKAQEQICEQRNIIFCPNRKNEACKILRHILRAWMAAEFAKKGRGAKRDLARILGIHESAISKILNGEKGKGFQTIDLAWVPAMETFFRSKAPSVVVEFPTEPRMPRDPLYNAEYLRTLPDSRIA